MAAKSVSTGRPLSKSGGDRLRSPHGAINKLSDVDAAYIAGLIDADGTVTVSGRDAPSPMVLVVNGNMPLIRWLLSTIGGGCAYETKTRPTRPDQNDAHWNAVHRFQITGLKAVALLEQVSRFMRVKHRQASLVMSVPMRGRDFPLSATAEQRARSFLVRDEIRALNQRGRKGEHQMSLVM